MTTKINHLVLSWSTSKGRDTYGYNICRLDDRNNGQRFRTIGGGYDMVGTVFGQWLQANYQDELKRSNVSQFYGAKLYKGDVVLDGACGLECMIQIAEAIGLEIERDYIAKGRRRGETVGWYVWMKKD